MSVVTVDPNQIVSRNRTSLGSHLMFSTQRNFWRSSTSQALAQQAAVRIMRISDYPPAGINPCTNWNNTTHHGTYDWADFDALLTLNKNLGIKTLLPLGFCGSSGWVQIANMPVQATGLPSPQDYAGYVYDIVQHVVSMGFDVPYYELVNEAWFYFYPNWTWNEAKALNFLALYNAGYDAVKSVASLALCGTDSSLYPRFNTFWKANNGRLDFLSTHKYDGWGRSYSDAQGLDSAEKKFFAYYDSNHMTVTEARAIWGDLPVLFTEANFNAVYAPTDPRLQGPVGQAWCGIVAMNCMRYGINYLHYFDWTSKPDTSYTPASLGFGLIKRDDNAPASVPYETYNILRDIFSHLSLNDELLATTVTGNTAAVKAQAWRHNGIIYCVIVNRGSDPVSVTYEGQLINFSTYGTVVVGSEPVSLPFHDNFANLGNWSGISGTWKVK